MQIDAFLILKFANNLERFYVQRILYVCSAKRVQEESLSDYFMKLKYSKYMYMYM